jgi:hypothetical protein
MWGRPLPILFGWFVVTGGSLELTKEGTAVWSLELENAHGVPEGISTSGTYRRYYTKMATQTGEEVRVTFIELRLADPEGYPDPWRLSGYLVGYHLTLEGLRAGWDFGEPR